MAYWFTDDPPPWKPGNRYNMQFAEIVRMIRAQYRLQKVSTGIERGTNHWVQCTFAEGTVYVTIKRFQWDKMWDSNSPLLLIDYEVAKSNRTVISQGTLEVIFPSSYPRERPNIRMQNTRYHNLADTTANSHSHHIFSNGWLCLTTSSDWKPEVCTILTALNWTWEWILFHYNKFGW